MKYCYLLAVVLVVFLVCVGCKSSGLFIINADQTVSVNVTDMPIAEFIDLFNDGCRNMDTIIFPTVHVRPEWKVGQRVANCNSGPLVSLNFTNTSLSNVVNILLTQYEDSVLRVGIGLNFDPNRIPPCQGGDRLVQWEGTLAVEGESAAFRSAEMLKKALGDSFGVINEVLPRQLNAKHSIYLPDDNSPISINDFVQTIECAVPIKFHFTNDCFVIRFDETGSNLPPFRTSIKNDKSFF